MGLDLCVEGRAKPGHEAEWREILQRSFDEKPKKGDEERYSEISLASYEQVGAPRVGFDAEADAWIIKTRRAETPEEIAQALSDFHGHYALPLVKCDGLPTFTHAELGYGVNECDLRGKVLELCDDVLSPALIEAAFVHRFPEDAITYGRALLGAADAAISNGPLPVPPPENKRGFFARFRRETKRSGEFPFEEQLEIVRMAGRWFLFWGERGNAIRAWT